ncbi:hypothetical protein RDI58_022543 [Solanum bulbocastanum]|uniref:Uncharacterized protein n=1 Tax=Solanum bulbocastanum TaxID=147425 RepID=A0AAN8T2V1_SOLBU
MLIQSQLQEQTDDIIGIEKATKDDMLDTVKREEDMVYIDDIEGTPSEDPTISTSVKSLSKKEQPTNQLKMMVQTSRDREKVPNAQQ